jgi:hypothetical protein
LDLCSRLGPLIFLCFFVGFSDFSYSAKIGNGDVLKILSLQAYLDVVNENACRD